MTLLNHVAPRTKEKRPIILDTLNHDVVRWSSVHGMGESLMKVQENVQMYGVKEEMRDGDSKNFKMGFED